MTMTIEKTKNINGTSLRGYISATINELRGVFGDPCHYKPSRYEKTQIEWDLLIDGVVVTIYDWKQGGYIPHLDEEVTWNVGGKTSEVLDLLKTALGK